MGLKSTIRHKIVNRKRRPLCDYEGKCKNLAYKEVYPFLLEKKHEDRGWSYLCRKHFKQELKRLRGKLPCSSVD
ncbi:MAG: hypothetical protein KKA64_03700 [Nanoarchaeota archaeon]|nr:hypothetical protein [Nanoarchaeota archaeon]